MFRLQIVDYSSIAPLLTSPWQYVGSPPNVHYSCPTREALGENQTDGCFVSLSYPNTNTWATLGSGDMLCSQGDASPPCAVNVPNNNNAWVATYTLHYITNGICESQTPYNENCANAPTDCGTCPTTTTTSTTTVMATQATTSQTQTQVVTAPPQCDELSKPICERENPICENNVWSCPRPPSNNTLIFVVIVVVIAFFGYTYYKKNKG